jgi:hypothetical protein
MHCLFTYAISFVVSLALQSFSDRLFAGFKWYRRFTEDQKIEWNAYAVSTLHAIVSSAAALVILFKFPALVWDPVFQYQECGDHVLMLTAGYLTADAYVVGTNAQAFKALTSTLVHHLSASFTFLYMMQLHSLQAFALAFVVTEASTPLVNLRYQLSAMGLGKSRMYVINGLTMLAVFFVIRIIGYPFLMWSLIYHTGTIFALKGALTTILLWAGALTGGVLNHMWFYKMVKGAIKVLGRRG